MFPCALTVIPNICHSPMMKLLVTHFTDSQAEAQKATVIALDHLVGHRPLQT